MKGRESQREPHPHLGIVPSRLLWGPVGVPMQSGLCGVKAVASHPEGHFTLEETKPRVHLWGYRRDPELSGMLGGKHLCV